MDDGSKAGTISSLPRNIRVLAANAALCWVVTLLWQVVDLDRIIWGSIKSDADAWLFALTLAPLYFTVKGMAAIWGTVLGVVTCLAAGHLLLRRLARRRRWLIVAGATALVFVGVPIALDRAEHGRLHARYARSDSPALPSLRGRSVVLRNDRPLPSTWHLPLACPSQCIDLLTFGAAESVTLWYPVREGAAGAGPVAATYRLGPAGRDCAGAGVNGTCPHLISSATPQDRLVLRIVPVQPVGSDVGRVSVKRLLALDSRRPAERAAVRTAFSFAGYPLLLNPGWREGALRPLRSGLPVTVDDEVEAKLYRDLVPNRVLDGAFYPFR